ncbi:hypothetical protein DPX16_14310 [Anabarilius grahami]|uniref:Uncharacterized protein n=1 Tax=Anabarilius grahami TaxID=495550 RepID=A0A3N0XM06_ANAGA|nr:hypothetical protein DPX16_14310 [Anabarilius grahami]
MSWPDFGLGSSQTLLSSTPIKRPIKRPRLELEEDPFGGSSSANVEQPSDSIYDPADSVTTLTEPTNVIESEEPETTKAEMTEEKTTAEPKEIKTTMVKLVEEETTVELAEWKSTKAVPE